MASRASTDAPAPASLTQVREAVEEAFAAVDTASREHLANLTHAPVAAAAFELPVRRAIQAAAQSAACLRDSATAIDQNVALSLSYGLYAAEREALELAKYLSLQAGGAAQAVTAPCA